MNEQTKREIEDKAFAMFARIYPHECYAQWPEDFCDYARTINPGLTDEEIKEHLGETE